MTAFSPNFASVEKYVLFLYAYGFWSFTALIIIPIGLFLLGLIGHSFFGSLAAVYILFSIFVIFNSVTMIYQGLKVEIQEEGNLKFSSTSYSPWSFHKTRKFNAELSISEGSEYALVRIGEGWSIGDLFLLRKDQEIFQELNRNFT